MSYLIGGGAGALFLAGISPQIGAAVIAGIFMILNSLLTIYVMREMTRRRNDNDRRDDDERRSGEERRRGGEYSGPERRSADRRETDAETRDVLDIDEGGLPRNPRPPSGGD